MMLTKEANSLTLQRDAAKFVDHFINANRVIPDFSLLTTLALRKNISAVLEDQWEIAVEDLLLCYALGMIRPTLSVIRGLHWTSAEVC